MKKTLLITLLTLIGTSNAFAWGEPIWCKVSLNEIKACYKTFDECSNSWEMGECKPFKK